MNKLDFFDRYCFLISCYAFICLLNLYSNYFKLSLPSNSIGAISNSLL